MEVSFKREQLLAVLSQTGRIVPSNPIMQILAMVKIEASGFEATVWASNLEVTMRFGIECVAPETVGFCIPHDLLKTACQLSDDENAVIHYNPENSSAVIESGNLKYNTGCEDAKIFPRALKIEETAFEIDAQPLKHALLSAVPFCGKLHPSTEGVLLEVHDEELTVVGCDAQQMYVRDSIEAITEDVRVIVTTSGAKAIAALCEDQDQVSLKLSKSVVKIATPGAVAWLQLIDQKYPDYRQILPSYQSGFVVNKRSLLDSLSAVDVASDKISKVIRMAVDGKTLRLSASSYDGNTSGASSIELSSVDCSDLEFYTTTAALNKCLRAVVGDEARIELDEDGEGPAIIKEPTCDFAVSLVNRVRYGRAA